MTRWVAFHCSAFVSEVLGQIPKAPRAGQWEGRQSQQAKAKASVSAEFTANDGC